MQYATYFTYDLFLLFFFFLCFVCHSSWSELTYSMPGERYLHLAAIGLKQDLSVPRGVCVGTVYICMYV